MLVSKSNFHTIVWFRLRRKKKQNVKAVPQSELLFKWRGIESGHAFRSSINIEIIINLQSIVPSIFLNDGKYAIIKKVLSYVKQRSCIKVNAIVNGECTLK